MDLIELRGIRAYGKHGASDAERAREQLLDIDVRVELDLAPASSSDNLERALDYAKLHERIVQTVRVRSYHLLERLAAELFQVIFTDVRVASAEVKIAKPQILDGATPSVHLTKKNPRYLPA